MLSWPYPLKATLLLRTGPTLRLDSTVELTLVAGGVGELPQEHERKRVDPLLAGPLGELARAIAKTIPKIIVTTISKKARELGLGLSSGAE